MEITVTLSDDVMKRAQRLAQVLKRPVESVIYSMLDDYLPAFPVEEDHQRLDSLSNQELAQLADGMMPVEQSYRMSELMAKRQMMPLHDWEQAELQILFEQFEHGQRHKTQALAELIKRGVRERIAS